MVNRVLITGGCGFIGKNLTALLVGKGIAVRVYDNLTVGTVADLQAVANVNVIQRADDITVPKAGEIQFIKGDILDAGDIHLASNDMDAIVHLAANTGVGPSVEAPVFDCQQNVLGTINVLEAARKNNIKKFVFASSGAPAGEVEPPIHEEIVPKPVSPYGASKLAGEGYCSAYFRTFEIDTVALRFGNVYGPGSGHKSSVVAKFINRALDQLPLEIYGDGSQTRDFIYIDDLVKAIYLGLTVDDIGGEVFQIATSQETTVREITDIIVDVLNKKSIAVPEVRFTEPRLGDVKRNFSDTRKASKKLGWEAKQDLADGVFITLNDIVDGRSSN